MKAVHFGAGNIGRGFVGLLLHEAGYEVVFADVNSALIELLQGTSTYEVREQGEGGRIHRVDNFRAINSATDTEALIDEIASADIVTTAVGPNVLKFVAPIVAAGLARRAADRAPLAVIACENAINATDLLAEQVRSQVTQADWPHIAARAAFANTAVDRIVPNQAEDAGTTVTVEAFYEWVIERGAFNGVEPVIPGATFVDNLDPYIERKLFTVNTGHATIAYLGLEAGATSIAEAMQNPAVLDVARRVLQETSTLLVDKHGLDEDAQRAYREKILVRFSNPALRDTVQRVGRQPLRKLSRNERFVGPAAEIAESGVVPVALLQAIGAALRFVVPDDEQSVKLQRLLRAESAEHVVQQVCGLSSTHPLYQNVVLEVSRAQGL